MLLMDQANNFLMDVVHHLQKVQIQMLINQTRKKELFSPYIFITKKKIIFYFLRSWLIIIGKCPWILRHTSPTNIWTSNCIGWIILSLGTWIFNVIICSGTIFPFIIVDPLLATIMPLSIVLRCCCCCCSLFWLVRSQTYLWNISRWKNETDHDKMMKLNLILKKICRRVLTIITCGILPGNRFYSKWVRMKASKINIEHVRPDHKCMCPMLSPVCVQRSKRRKRKEAVKKISSSSSSLFFLVCIVQLTMNLLHFFLFCSLSSTQHA